MRPNNRENNQPRQIKITRNYTKHAEGSVLVEFGDTKVLCTATVEDAVPRFLKGQGQGWVTAEYGMLPRSTHVAPSTTLLVQYAIPTVENVS